jgi:hypothetical protein
MIVEQHNSVIDRHPYRPMWLVSDLSESFKLPLVNHTDGTIQERGFLKQCIAHRIQDGPISHPCRRSDVEAIDNTADTPHRDRQFQAEGNLCKLLISSLNSA